MSSSVTNAKKIIRAQMKQQLAKLSPDTIERESSTVAQKLFQMPEWNQSKNVSIFLNMGGEVATKEIVQRLFQDGTRRVFVPRCTREKMEMCWLPSISDYHALPKNNWGIPEPSAMHSFKVAFESKEYSLDLILMPGVCFNDDRVRLGHGKGYYDKYLSFAIDKSREFGLDRPITIALALEEQLLGAQDIPNDDYDLKPDVILSPGRIIK